MKKVYFIWTHDSFTVGMGGSETYVIGINQELRLRNIEASIVLFDTMTKTTNLGAYAHLFKKLASPRNLQGTHHQIVCINNPVPIGGSGRPYLIYTVEPRLVHSEKLKGFPNLVADYGIIVLSKDSQNKWSDFLHVKKSKISIVYPFVDDAYTKVKSKLMPTDTFKLLFAGRLHPDKGIYTLLEAFYLLGLHTPKLSLTVTDSGIDTTIGATLYKMLQLHPLVQVVKRATSPQEMAELYTKHTHVIMPSNVESFGMVSVEAQAVGLQVIASNIDGLPETQMGNLTLVEPRNPSAIVAALLSSKNKKRNLSKNIFTVQKSVDQLLQTMGSLS